MAVKTSAARCNFDFSGTHVAITGGGQGLGRAYSRAFAAAGATVFILDRNFETACKVVDEIKAAGSMAFAYQLDVGRLDDVSDVFSTIINEHDRIDILINNAAIFTTLEMKPFYNIDPAEWANVINVNLQQIVAVLVGVLLLTGRRRLLQLRLPAESATHFLWFVSQVVLDW